MKILRIMKANFNLANNLQWSSMRRIQKATSPPGTRAPSGLWGMERIFHRATSIPVRMYASMGFPRKKLEEELWDEERKRERESAREREKQCNCFMKQFQALSHASAWGLQRACWGKNPTQAEEYGRCQPAARIEKNFWKNASAHRQKSSNHQAVAKFSWLGTTCRTAVVKKQNPFVFFFCCVVLHTLFLSLFLSLSLTLLSSWGKM